MKLPLRVHWDYYGRHQVIDAAGRIIMTLDDQHRKFIVAVVRKFNRNWRYVLFGSQPFEYTREDWLAEKNNPIRQWLVNHDKMDELLVKARDKVDSDASDVVTKIEALKQALRECIKNCPTCNGAGKFTAYANGRPFGFTNCPHCYPATNALGENGQSTSSDVKA